ncbi:MAG: transcription antitermination factor NusB [Clostridia bacterium]|nr:transcription antitermination factor NusB [Clostridia bacterium]
MSKKQTRSEARQCAFMLVFSYSMNKEDEDFLISELVGIYPEATDNLPYIKGTFLGVFENKEIIDAKIKEALPENRGITRLSKVALAILRVAVYEIFFSDDVPEKVAINEAVEIAKKYAEDEAPKFINGVLSGVVKN